MQNSSLRLGFNQPNVSLTFRKSSLVGDLLSRNARNSSSKQVLSSTHYSRTRFYSSLLAFRALKSVPKRASVGDGLSFTGYTLHTSRVWRPYYLNLVSYHRLLGSRPRRKNLEGARRTILNPDNSLVTRSSTKKINIKSTSLNRLRNNPRVQQFMYYVRLRSVSEDAEPLVRLPNTGANMSMSSRRLRFVKDERYFKPYTFVGLKKIPKYLKNDPFRALFKRVKRLLRTSRAYAPRNKPKMIRSTSPLSRTLKITRSAKPVGAAPTSFPILAKVVLSYKAKRSMSKFLKARKLKLPKPFPKLFSRRIPLNTLPRLTRVPYRPLHSSLTLDSLNSYRDVLRSPQPLSPIFAPVYPKFDVTYRASILAPRPPFAHSPASDVSVALRDSLTPCQDRGPKLRHLWSLFSARSLAAPRAQAVFAVALSHWIVRKNPYLKLTLTSPTKFKSTLRRLLPRLKKRVYAKAWMKRAFFRSPFRTLILKACAPVKSARNLKPRILVPSTLPFGLGSVYFTNQLVKWRPVSRRLLRSKPLRNFSPTLNVRSAVLTFLPLIKTGNIAHSEALLPQSKFPLNSQDPLKHSLSLYLTRRDPTYSPFGAVISLRTPAKMLRTAPQLPTLPILKLPLFKLVNLKLTSNLAMDNSLNPTRLKIYSSYGPDFVRSPFFFLKLFSLRNPYLTDLVAVKKRLRSRFTYLVFPDANDIKVAIFRRLNRQKFLAQSRMFTLNTITHVRSKYKFRSNLIRKGATAWPFRFRQNKAILNGDPTNLKTREVLTRFVRMRKRSVRIRRIRFKPGYGRIWRKARKSVREILNIHSRYQYRLTPKLQDHYFKNRSRPKSFMTFNLGFALMTTRLAPDVWSSAELLKNNYVFLNGTTTINPSTKLFLNDLIQLVVNLKFYITLRWLRNWYGIKQNRINKIYYRKFRPSTYNKNIRVVRTLPTWFYDLQYTYCDVPKYFEMDYFTLSVFVVHDLLKFEKWMPTKADLYNPSQVNMYNWKYIT